MRNYKKYHIKVIEIFQSYLLGKIELIELHDRLHLIQSELGFDKSRGIKCLFIGSKEDENSGRTINYIYFELKHANESIRNFIQSLVNNPKLLMVNYT